MAKCKALSDPAVGTFLTLDSDYGIGLPAENGQLIDVYQRYNKLINIAKKIHPNLTDVVDGGSNIGTWSIPLSVSHRELTFHTFEVQRAIYNLQCANVTLNNAWNVYPNWTGLSNTDGEIDIFQPDYSKRSNFGAFEVHAPFKNSDDDSLRTGRSENVKMVSIDSLSIRPLLIKLDLEGMEWPAIYGGKWTIDAYNPIVWAESHKSDADKIVPFFTERHYMQAKFDDHWLFVPAWLQNNPELDEVILRP